MDILPAIDLLEGRCVRLYQGDYNRAETFSDEPAAVARQWVAQGTTWLHLVDLDGARDGQPTNQPAIAAIVAAAREGSGGDRPAVKIQVGGGLRDRESVARLLDLGVDRAILGTAAVERPELVSELAAEFPGRIAVGIDARDGRVAVRGWRETSTVLATDLARQMQDRGAAAIVYTDIHRDGTLTGPNKAALREMAEAISIPVIASGGISSTGDLLGLLGLEPLGVTGAIVGKALYAGKVDLKEALRAVGPGRWQDVPPNLGGSALA